MDPVCPRCCGWSPVPRCLSAHHATRLDLQSLPGWPGTGRPWACALDCDDRLLARLLTRGRAPALALAVGGSEMATLLTADVAALLTNGSVRPIVRKKASLALLRLLRKSPDPAEEILPPEVHRTKEANGICFTPRPLVFCRPQRFR